MKGFVQVVGVWEMCCERMGADPGETEGVPGEVWLRRRTTLTAGKALRFVDNIVDLAKLEAMSVTIPK